jgi:hypothetical protein
MEAKAETTEVKNDQQPMPTTSSTPNNPHPGMKRNNHNNQNNQGRGGKKPFQSKFNKAGGSGMNQSMRGAGPRYEVKAHFSSFA